MNYYFFITYISQELKFQDAPEGCWKADPRLSQNSTQQCQKFIDTKEYERHSITLKQMFPEGKLTLIQNH